ncbi:MAG: lysylphosphatidylglycerol synthase transmembrane domain-containing protein [Chloroflexota bacterium]
MNSKFRLPRWLPGAIISILLIVVILQFVDLNAMLEAVRQADYRLLAGATVLSFVWMAVRAKVWQTLLRDRPTYKDTLFTVGEGYLLNNFLPFRLGEIGRAFLIARKSGMQFAEVLPTIVIERVVDLGISASLLLVSLPYVITHVSGAQDAATAQNAERIGTIAGGVVLFGLVMLYVLAHYNQWALNLFHKLSARWPSLQKFGGGFLESFFEGLGVLKDGWLFVRFLLWMTLNWGVALAAYYLMMLAYFPETEFIWIFFILSAVAFGGAIPAAPGAIGTFEGAFAGAVVLLVGQEFTSTALAVALTARLYNYLNSGVVGFIGLSREGETLGGVYRELMALRKKETEEVVPPS